MLSINISKRWKGFCLNVDFVLQKGEIITVLGSSGCGKSTLLNLIAGVVAPDSGKITFDEEIIYCDNEKNSPIYKRNIGYIQQKSNLFPHMNVIDNICYGVKGEVNKSKLKELLNISGIMHIQNKKTYEISGGQQQRVSIARALMTKPKILLLDEPFSALDNRRRRKLRELLLDIKEELGIPMIFVTHDLEEAYALGDKVAVMNNGKFLQLGSREDVFRTPKNIKTAKFVGMSNIIWGEVVDKNTVLFKGVFLKIPSMNYKQGKKIALGIRPEEIIFIKEEEITKENENSIFNGVVNKEICGIESCRLEIALDKTSSKLEMSLPNYIYQEEHIGVGDKIRVFIKNSRITCLSDKGYIKNGRKEN
ncbi:ABC transporter ATP-binding protein [Clostridium sediminicola]|uniref:ABC transporter ATP-binding protein n=1 Tax=Clostridium sediminicola TaxID=3114879 RepID=UPI0031F21F7F